MRADSAEKNTTAPLGHSYSPAVIRSVSLAVMASHLVLGTSCQHDSRLVAADALGPAESDARTLRPLSAFAALHSDEERSVAFFIEATKVMLHPRCSNCHPAGDSPLQGLEQRIHDPPVIRGPEDHGVVGMECGTCHQPQNQPLARVPGAPKWSLAPRIMAWVGRTPHQLCEQLKDPARNGGKTLAQIQEHSAHDELVAWGWVPGSRREPAPGSQREFGALIDGWVATGAHCPAEKTP